MEFLIAILALASPFLIYLICRSLILKHFQKIYNSTGKNPITLFQQVLPTFIYLPIVIACFDINALYHPMLVLGIPGIIITLILISNLHWIRPGRVLGMTICHLVYGTMTVLRVLWWVVLCMFSILESIMYGNGFKVEYNPFIFLNVNDEGSVTEYKKETFFFRPKPNYAPTMLPHNSATVESIRHNYLLNEIEDELRKNRDARREAMIYGKDTSKYDKREAELEDVLSKIK